MGADVTDKIIVIGRDSNLSQRLAEKLNYCILLSSRELLADIDILKPYRDSKIKLIFNNFQPATRLNELSDPATYIDNAIASTASVLNYFDPEMVEKIIYTSSSSVYGDNILCSEDDPFKPTNLHAALKVSNEELVAAYCRQQGIDYTIARVFNMYGGDDHFSIISKIIKACRSGNSITIVNNGNAIRDFIHIDDVIRIYLKLIEIKDVNVINVGTGSGVSIKSIIDFLKYSGVRLETDNLVRQEIKVSTADRKRLLQVLGKGEFYHVEAYLRHELDL